MFNAWQKLCLYVFSCAFLGVTGCAHTPTTSSTLDPYENVNRKIFAFNNALDRIILRPIAVGYDKLFPRFIKCCIGNILSNLKDIPGMVYELLQGNFHYMSADFARVFLNTTIGIGGLFDVGTHLGVPYRQQDFGVTLGVWGNKKAPFIVIPFFGSMTMRELVASPVDFALNPLTWVKPATISYSITGGEKIKKRADLLATDSLMRQAFDPYIFMRNAYLQQRDYLIEQYSSVAASQDTATDND